MGGKAKQSQRTKNNARPSSSGRSAELLNNVIKTDSVFGTFNSGKMLPALFPTMAPTTHDNALSNEFTLAFKKLTKKDPITRNKALQELLEIINKSDVEEIVASLPNWTVFYLMLTVDSDRKVRELTQSCNGSIFHRCGRQVAPHVRRLLPVWLLAVHDDYGPARHMASTNLHSTFPGHKLSEAIAFCKSEIITLIVENLTGNAEAILNKKIEEPEERQAAAARVRAGSLGALGLLLKLLPSNDDLSDPLQPLFLAPAFWKLHTHDDHHVRTAWYEAVGRAIERQSGRLGDTVGGKLAMALVAQPERRSDVATARWAAVLLLLHVQEWRQWLKKKDLLLKRFLDTIENGGWGNASLLSGILLPLLSKLPEDLLTKEFYYSLFNALFAGLELKTIYNSKSERQVWIANIADCLRYISIQKQQYVLEIISSAHRIWLEKIFGNQDQSTRSHLIKVSASKMASLVKYWIQQSTETTDDIYDKLSRNFWQNLGATIVTQIENVSIEDDNIAKLLNSHTIMFESLSIGEGERKKSLRFDDVPASESGKASGQVEEDEVIVERFKHSVMEFLSKGCSAWLDYAERREVRAVFPPLVAALQRVGSEELFVHLSRARDGGKGSVYGLYEGAWCGWLRGDTLRCRALVELLFLASTYFTEHELELMYDSFNQMPPVVVEWCISLCLSSAVHSKTAGAKWLRSSLVAGTLTSLCRRRHPIADDLVLNCLTSREVCVSSEAVSGVISALCEQPIRRAPAAAVCRVLADTPHASAAAPLAALLFDYSLDTFRDNHMTEDEEIVVNVAQSDGWRALCSPDLIAHAKNRLHGKLMNLDESLDIAFIEHLVYHCLPLTSAGELTLTAAQFLNLDIEQSVKAVCTFALRKDCVYGRLLCPFQDDHIKSVIEIAESNSQKDLESRDVVLFSRALCFRAGFLREIVKEGERWCDHSNEEYFRGVFVDLLHDSAIVNSLCDGYAFAPFHKILKNCKEYLCSAIQELFSLLKAESKKHIANTLTKRAHTIGYYWAIADRQYQGNMRQKETEDVEMGKESEGQTVRVKECGVGPEENEENSSAHDQLIMDKIVTCNGFFHTLQAGGSLRGRYVSAVRGWYVAQGFDSDRTTDRKRQFMSKLPAALSTHNLMPLMDDYYKYCEKMFNERDYWKVSWSVVTCESGVVDFLRDAVDAAAWELDAPTWDFINIVLCSVLTSLARTPTDHLSCTKVAMMARAALSLFASVVRFVDTIRTESERRTPSTHVSALPDEWRDIFAPAAYTDLLTIYQRLLERCMCGDGQLTVCNAALAEAAAVALPLVQWERAAATRRAEDLSLERLTSAALDALSHDFSATSHYLAYSALITLAKPLVLNDVEKLKQASEREGEEEDSKVSLSLQLYLTALRQRADCLLPDERCTEDSPPASWWGHARGFLLTALAALLHADLARSDLVHHYINCLGESETIGTILSVATRALPISVRRAISADSVPLPAHTVSWFTINPRLSIRDADPQDAVGRLSCRVVFCAVRGAGGAARAHWSALSGRRANTLRRLVVLAVAPALIDEQLARLRERATDLVDVEVSVSRSGGQCMVRARALIEERWAEVAVTLATAHPLEPPRVDPPQNQPLAASQLHWVRVYLAYQNGWLVTALRLWSEALRSRVDAAAQCYICYCRLHPTTARLPSVPCYTCNNRFHSACLRKWFKTSHKSNCPLCRTVF